MFLLCLYISITIFASSLWTWIYSSYDNTRDYGATRLSTNECHQRPTVISSSITAISDPSNRTNLNPTIKPSQLVLEAYLSEE